MKKIYWKYWLAEIRRSSEKDLLKINLKQAIINVKFQQKHLPGRATQNGTPQIQPPTLYLLYLQF